MSGDDTVLDWTQGGDGIAYQRCDRCASIWYMRRQFCPACGNASPQNLQASGRGTVYSAATVTRAPSEALRAYAPYTIALVDCDEGFRVMAHADNNVVIGDKVVASFIDFGGRTIPQFKKLETS